MEKIYVLEVIDWAYVEPLGYYKTQDSAHSRLKKLVKEKMSKHRKDKTLAKKEDLERSIKNGEIEFINRSEVPADSFKAGVVCEATVSYFYKCSYEYDEWDLGGATFRIREADLKP